MTGIHHMLVHFPVGFWLLATVMIVIGALMTNRLAQLSRAALLPVLILAQVAAVLAIASGFLVWPVEAALYSPLTRNHILMSLWAVGVYTVILVLVWRAGDAAFVGSRRWALVVLALTGNLFFAAAGTLGGHLVGAPTAFSEVLRLSGWEVYTTFYSPTWALIVAVLIVGVTWMLARRHAN